MKELLVIIFMLSSCIISAEVPVPTSVKTFYSGMQKLSQISDANRAYDISKSMKECFFGVDVSVSGIPLPNDFRFFNYDDKNLSHRDHSLNSATYVNRLSDYIYKDRVLKVEYKILKNEYAGDQPDFNKGKISASSFIIATCVEKTYILRGTKKVFNDTVYTDYSNGKISEIKNGHGETVKNIGTLRIKAALAYRLRRYDEAYKCYQEIISIADDNADALYRIGLMTYYQQGCYFSKKTFARKKGKEYMERARVNGLYSNIGDKAKNVLHNWKYARL